LVNEFLLSALRRRLSFSLDELQFDLDRFVDGYNAGR
jgi:hypothetical protein